MKKLIFSLFLTLTFKVYALGTTRPLIFGGDDTPSANPIAQQTVMISGQIQRASFLCSGSILANNLILTAGHCLGGGGYATLKVHFGVKGEVATINVINQIRKIDNFPIGQEHDWDDIAVLRLEKNIPAGFKPVKFLQDPSLIMPGSYVTLAGYGRNVPYEPTNGNGSSGILRSVEQVVLEYPFGQAEFLVSIKDRGACSGDSGGPAFVKVNGELQQIGLANRVTEKNRLPDQGRTPRYACIVDMVYADVLAQKAWIDSAVQELSK